MESLTTTISRILNIITSIFGEHPMSEQEVAKCFNTELIGTQFCARVKRTYDISPAFGHLYVKNIYTQTVIEVLNNFFVFRNCQVRLEFLIKKLLKQLSRVWTFKEFEIVIRTNPVAIQNNPVILRLISSFRDRNHQLPQSRPIFNLKLPFECFPMK